MTDKHTDKFMICQTTIASRNQGVFQGQPLYDMEYSSESVKSNHPRYKSSGTATMLALFPGFIIHGCGHFYANDVKSGLILLGIEVISVYGILQVAIADAFSTTHEKKNKALRGTVVALGITGFLGSWIYDIVHSDIAVKNYNQRMGFQVAVPENYKDAFCISFSFAL